MYSKLKRCVVFLKCLISILLLRNFSISIIYIVDKQSRILRILEGISSLCLWSSEQPSAATLLFIDRF